VNYVLAGIGPDGCELSEGPWTVELPDHALGRALQRVPDQDMDALVLAAHRAVLQAQWHGAFTDPKHRFLVPAGAGALLLFSQRPVRLAERRGGATVRRRRWRVASAAGARRGSPPRGLPPPGGPAPSGGATRVGGLVGGQVLGEQEREACHCGAAGVAGDNRF